MLAARFICEGSDQSRGDSQCVSYSLAQFSSQLRLDLQAAFTTSKPPTLNRSRARRSNSLAGPYRDGFAVTSWWKSLAIMV
jgi:hypothetical protein